MLINKLLSFVKKESDYPIYEALSSPILLSEPKMNVKVIKFVNCLKPSPIYVPPFKILLCPPIFNFSVFRFFKN